MFNFAGVILDHYDDKGATLREMFPTVDQLPDLIKEADVRPVEKLALEDFALVMLDQGQTFAKYACYDPGTTAMSVIYFMEHGDKLPEDAQKTAAANLVEACVTHNIMPPATLTKTSGSLNGKRMVDVTGIRSSPRMKIAQPRTSADYAVVLPDGSRHYPIHDEQHVKLAEQYFQEEAIRMQPEIRRQFAVKLAAKSEQLGYDLNNEIVKLGATTYAPDGHIHAAVEMRKLAGGEAEFLDELFEKRAMVEPGVFAECLRRHDVMEGLDRVWDDRIPSPWESTFGINKVAEVVWDQGADQVTSESLVNLARNHSDQVDGLYNEYFSFEFQKDPVGVFKSLPDPQKRILGRMAMDNMSQGEAEFMPTKNDPGGGLDDGKPFKVTFGS